MVHVTAGAPTFFDKDPGTTDWGLDERLEWVPFQGVRVSTHRLMFTGDSIEEICSLAQEIRDRCPGKPSYLLKPDEPPMSYYSDVYDLHLMVAAPTSPNPAYLVSLALVVFQDRDFPLRRPPLAEMLAKKLHSRLAQCATK